MAGRDACLKFYVVRQRTAVMGPTTPLIWSTPGRPCTTCISASNFCFGPFTTKLPAPSPSYSTLTSRPMFGMIYIDTISPSDSMVLLPASPLRPDATGSGAYVADDAQGPAGAQKLNAALNAVVQVGGLLRVPSVCPSPPTPPTHTHVRRKVCLLVSTNVLLQPKTELERNERP